MEKCVFHWLFSSLVFQLTINFWGDVSGQMSSQRKACRLGILPQTMMIIFMESLPSKWLRRIQCLVSIGSFAYRNMFICCIKCFYQGPCINIWYIIIMFFLQVNLCIFGRRSMSKKCLFNIPLPRSESSATMWDLLCFCSLDFFAWYPWKSKSTVIKEDIGFSTKNYGFLLSIGNFQILQNLWGSILLLVGLVFKPGNWHSNLQQKKAYHDGTTMEVPHEAGPGNPRDPWDF